ncbi:hypothetical protein [Streptomyces odontomachi]|uniref:hypothetical protein n=1 Tax=Streptomyces odontomachi TaxID=2944940 RepID=UPI00272DDA08|nr:hypothetical protein [Streptomyces sp. ODS25]
MSAEGGHDPSIPLRTPRSIGDQACRHLLRYRAARPPRDKLARSDVARGGSGRRDVRGGAGGRRRRAANRPGIGTAVAARAAGLAVGVVGGMVAAGAVDEIGDFFEGDEEDED